MPSLGLLYWNAIFNPITTQENYLANSCSSIRFAFRIGTTGPGGAWFNLTAPSLVKWISSIAYGIIKFFEKWKLAIYLSLEFYFIFSLFLVMVSTWWACAYGSIISLFAIGIRSTRIIITRVPIASSFNIIENIIGQRILFFPAIYKNRRIISFRKKMTIW